MIQRIQTVYLFFAAIVLPFLFLIPFLSFNGNSQSAWYTITGGEIQRADGSTLIEEVELFPGLAHWISVQNPYSADESIIITSVLLAIPFLGFIISIFLYKKRKRQMKFVYINIALLLLFAIPFFIAAFSTIKELSNAGFSISPFGSLGLLIPIISLVLAWLAAKNIKKDEALVRSADRIR